MSDFIIYLIKANVALSLFYLGYRLWLAHLTFYKINRYYLLFSLGFAAIYPSVHTWEWFSPAKEIHSGVLTVLPDWQQLQSSAESLETTELVEGIFGIGAAVIFLLLVLQLGSIFRIHLSSVPAQWKTIPYRNTKEKIGPFSFWKNIYFNADFYKEDQYEKIFRHEQVHIQQLHSLDILMAEIAFAFFWYNPIFWLIRNSIRQNLEYLTDQKVLSSGMDKKNYQYSLLQISLFPSHPILGNHFNFQNLKKRMIMMNKNQSSKFNLGAYILIFPAVVFGSFIFGSSHALNYKNVPAVYQNYKTQDEKKQERGVVSADTLPEGENPIVKVDGRKVHYAYIQSLDKEKIKSVNVVKGVKAIEQYGEEGKNGVIEIVTHIDNPMEIKVDANLDHDITLDIQVDTDPSVVNVKNNKESVQGTGLNTAESKDASMNLSGEISENVLILVNGKKIHRNQMGNIAPEQIESISVYKGVNAEEHFGRKGKDGVIEIFLKGDKP